MNRWMKLSRDKCGKNVPSHCNLCGAPILNVWYIPIRLSEEDVKWCQVMGHKDPFDTLEACYECTGIGQ